MTVFRIVFAAIFVFAICSTAGQLLLRALGLRLRRQERMFLEFITGSAVVSTLVFFLAAARLAYTWIFAGTGILILLAWWLFRDKYVTPPEPENADLTRGWRILFWVPYLIFGALYILVAMSPEISPDGTVYHVGLVTRYYEHRGFLPIDNMYAGLSAGIEMLFLVAFALGRHSATAIVHLLFLLTLPFGMLAFARRVNAPRAGVIAALLFYVAPVIGRDGTCAYIDVATAAVLFGAFCFLQIWREEQRRGALIAAGLLAGFCYACKITAATAIPYAVLFVVFVSRSRGAKWNRAIGSGMLVGGLALVVAGPWIVKDVIQFHNPFYPLFNHWFPNPYLYPMVEDELRQLMAHTGDVPYSAIPYEAAVGGKLFGILGPVFLLSPLALLSLRRREGRQLLLVFIPAFLPYLSNTGARFLIPSLPFLSILLATGLLAIPRAGAALAVLVALTQCVASWPPILRAWAPGFQWQIDPVNWRAALRIIPEKTFLQDHWRDYAPGLLLDRFVPPGERVFSPSMGQLAYQHRDLIGTFESSLAHRVFQTFFTPFAPVLASTWERQFRFPAMATDRIRIAAGMKRDVDLTINEVRFFHGAEELPRKNSWRLTASSNPWEVPLAFDNSPVSWWTSGQTVEPGTHLEIRFGETVQLDRIVVDQVVDQRWTALHAEAPSRSGEWKTLPASETGVEAPPRPDLRMAVRDELKNLGLRWILIPDDSLGADDLRKESPQWGITQVAEANGFRLWRLN